MEQSKKLLTKHFGYENFRPGQEKIVQHLLNHEDCLGIMPTGAGKSICYQIPALIFPGTTIVISPLISLMKDQVDTLNKKQIPASYINSTLSTSESKTIMQNALNGNYKIIYIAPERLEVPSFIDFLNTISISMIAIDEAHCVSQWGHDFRKSYLQIANVISRLKSRPIISAFTATATNLVKEDIKKILNLNNPFTLITGFDRENLSFQVLNSANKKEFVVNYLESHKNVCGIIYCLSRKKVDSLYCYLNSLSFSVCKYHGGMSEKQRSKNQDEFISGKFMVMIATNAFGMGIDKPDIRYVIHYNMPKDLESYYQEAGRAGRDGQSSECILLFSKSDIISNKFLIEHSNKFASHSTEYKKLNQIIAYCSTKKCLRKYMLEYFGEHPTFKVCNYCSNCIPNKELNNIQNAEILYNKISKSSPETITNISYKKNLESTDVQNSYNKELFSILKAVRIELSLQYKVPAFIIFHNKTLIEMCQKLPKNIEEFLQISGIGKYKAEEYGASFISAINEYLEKEQK